ncbi:Carbonic anhydrase-related protein 10 [Lamellibrachia satsuma]|nr:Carbonic anhydrase-related protein 10 [Lamellibrachia satsuma]
MLIVLIQVVCYATLGLGSTWSEWWSYEGISGPDFWGLVNQEWSLCSKGRRQSPINIQPKQLLFDPNLKHIRVDKHRVSGTMKNTGHDVKFLLDDPLSRAVNISGGPLSYDFRVSEISLHFGRADSLGSEHTIDGQAFPAEVHILGYNSDLYDNVTEAAQSTNGLAVIALLGQVTRPENPDSGKPNPEFELMAQKFKYVKYKGEQVRLRHLSIHGLLPDTTDYLTYEGSMTQPGCHETVTWVIINKPLYMSRTQLATMRGLLQSEEGRTKVHMENNSRPPAPLHHRVVRTNINFAQPSKSCTMEKQLYYQANVWDLS